MLRYWQDNIIQFLHIMNMKRTFRFSEKRIIHPNKSETKFTVSDNISRFLILALNPEFPSGYQNVNRVR